MEVHRLLTAGASLATEHRLRAGSVVVADHGRGNLPKPGIKPMTPALADGPPDAWTTREAPAQVSKVKFRQLLREWIWRIGEGVKSGSQVWTSATESMESPFHSDGKGNTERRHRPKGDRLDTQSHFASPHLLNVKTIVKGLLNCLKVGA